jgi:hypothetical protein
MRLNGAQDAPPLDRRWLILFGAALSACAALSFYYPRHRHGAPAVPLLAYCAYLSLRVLLWRLDNIRGPIAVLRPPLLTWMTIAGLACALLWPLRVVAGFEFLRWLGARSLANWHNKMPEYWLKAGSDYQPFLLPSANPSTWFLGRGAMIGSLGFWACVLTSQSTSEDVADEGSRVSEKQF